MLTCREEYRVILCSELSAKGQSNENLGWVPFLYLSPAAFVIVTKMVPRSWSAR